MPDISEATITAPDKMYVAIPATIGVEVKETMNIIGDGNGDGSLSQQESFVWKDESEGEGVGSSNNKKTALNNRSWNMDVVENIAATVMGCEDWPSLSESRKHYLISSTPGPCNVGSVSSTAVVVNTPPPPSSFDQYNVIDNGIPDATQNVGKQACGENRFPNGVVSNHPSSPCDSVVEGSNSNGAHAGASSKDPSDGGSIDLGTNSANIDANPSANAAHLTSNSRIPTTSPAVNDTGRDRHRAHNTASRETGHRNNGNNPQSTNSYRRGNWNLHSRPETYGNSCEQKCIYQRNFDSKDPYMSLPPPPFPWWVRPPPPIIGAPPPVYGPVIHASPPFHAPLPEYQSPFYDAPHGLPPYFRPLAPLLPPPDPRVIEQLIRQIHYYFSKDNLVKDTFLRARMDKHGWVPISLIAGFPQVAKLTDNIPLILDTMRQYSTVVEIQGWKIRKRVDWHEWMLPPPVQSPSVTSSLPLKDHLSGG